MIKKFITFTGVGAIGTLAHYLTMIALVQFFSAQPVIGSSAGALVGAGINYILNYTFTFKSNSDHRATLWKFMLIAAVGFTLNGIFMGIFTGMFKIYYLIAQLLTTGLVLIWNFLANHFWTFREYPQTKPL